MELKTILLPTLNASPAKRGDLLINGIGELVIVDYDDSVACGVDLFLCSTLTVKNGDWAFDLVYKRIVKIKSVKDNFVALDVEEGLTHSNISNLRKIEFTTDPKLIADGVPKIDGNTKAWISNINIKEGDELTHIKSGETQTFVRWEGTMLVTRYETEIGKSEDWIESSLFQFKEQEVNFLEELCKRYNKKDELLFTCAECGHTKDSRIFSFEDMRDVYNYGTEMGMDDRMNNFHKYIQSITKEQSKEIIIECEMETVIDSSRYGTALHEEPFVQRIKLNKDRQPVLTFKNK